MGMIHIMERAGKEDLHEYKKALKMAKKSIETLCELTEEMEEQYGRGGKDYEERRGYRMRSEHDWDEMDERRSRDSRGRYM